ncbi:MAG: hypothetical protein IJ703_12000 [Eubacterium sp.]|nr:hypothetical protein [Eubacterium sp.]MBR1675663.1 hypothetical protein [Eubacterium sp.]
MLEASGRVAFTKTTSERPANRYGDSVIIIMRDLYRRLGVSDMPGEGFPDDVF